MVGISGDIFIWISHFLFNISRNKPKIDLRRLMMKNEYAKARGMVIRQRKVSFTKHLFFYTVFIDHEMREGVIKLYVFFSYSLFIVFNILCFFFLSTGRFFVVNLIRRKIIPSVVRTSDFCSII
jgi:hypothetical protein